MTDIHISYTNDELLDPSTKNSMQFDIYVPRYPYENARKRKHFLKHTIYSLAFDCHDETFYHFSGVFGPPEAHQKRNELKIATCAKNGIALINVHNLFNPF